MGELACSSTTKKGGLLLGLLLLSACVGPTSQLPKASYADTQAEIHKQLVITISDRDDQARRLSRISEPILAANTSQCGSNIAHRAGVNFSSALLNTSNANRSATVEARGLSRAGEVRIGYTVPGFPAEGLLRPGDVVTRINGVNAYSAYSGLAKVNLQRPTMRLLVLRDGQQVDVSVPTIPVCGYRVILATDDAVNASAGNNTITLTTGIMRLMNTDRDIALVFGHEMAHLTRKHQDAKKTNAAVGAIVAAVVSGLSGVNVVDIGAEIGAGAFSQEFESEADYVGMYHASRAGWDMTGAANLFRRMASANPRAIHATGSTHPSTVSRAVLVERTALEIESKRSRQLALIPNFKGQPPTNVPLAGLQQAGLTTGIAKAPKVASISAGQPGDAAQQYRRGVEFEQGTDGPQDYAEAVKWYRKAAAQGHRDALYNLGMMYANARGVQKNNGEAMIYFRRAAELKHPDAHFIVGFMLENGRGVARSPARGLTSYIIASSLGAGEAAINARDRVAARLSPAHVGEAERQARAWIDAHRR